MLIFSIIVSKLQILATGKNIHTFREWNKLGRWNVILDRT